MLSMRKPLLLSMTFLLLIPWFWPKDRGTLPSVEEKIKGFSWESGDSIQSKHLKTILPYNAEWIAHTPFAFQGKIDEPELRFRRSKEQSSRNTRVNNTIEVAKGQGIHSMIKPHIWPGRDAGGWRSEIAMKNEADWQIWFANYTNYILDYAELAEAQKTPVFCIGTELYLASSRRTEDWRTLIKAVREVYSGKLTYAANFYKEFSAVEFWDDLDYIGVQAYFPLSNSKTPSLKSLEKSWVPHYKTLKKMAKKWEKPILFTEIGYRSMRDAAIEPWLWPDRMEYETQDVSPETQALCYEAFFKTFWEEKWVAGAFIWIWSRRNYDPGRYEQRRRNRRRRDDFPIDFSPKEPGLKVIQSYYGI